MTSVGGKTAIFETACKTSSNRCCAAADDAVSAVGQVTFVEQILPEFPSSAVAPERLLGRRALAAADREGGFFFVGSEFPLLMELQCRIQRE